MSTLSLSLVQTNLYWEDKAANLRMLEEKINGISQPTNLVILPEMFSTGFSMKPELLAEKMDGPTVNWMRQTAMDRRVILTGSIIVEDEGHYYNRLLWMQPNGQYGYYDKRHLFALGEEHKHYSAGAKRMIASVNGWKINLQICYDLRFPVWARQSPRHIEKRISDEAEYDLLLYVANWPERRSHAWKTLLAARAIENQCYVAGVNRVGNDGNDIYHSGNSMVIDPLGEILCQQDQDETILSITLHKNELQEIRTKLPFGNDADDFLLV
ncbi:MAG: amidohydrolase [Chitinophagaceae bacterium]